MSMRLVSIPLALLLLALTVFAAYFQVIAEQKISSTTGGLVGPIDNGDMFGSAIVPLGDLDGDGITDLAVGATSDDDGGPARGAVWILFLDALGNVQGEQKISSTLGGLIGPLADVDQFGESLAVIGDVNDDGVVDLAVGAIGDDDGGAARGAVWILFMNTNGTVKAEQKISDTTGGFSGTLEDYDAFGDSLAAVGDLDDDGVPDLAVGVTQASGGGNSRGAVWLLYLQADGTVKADREITDTSPDFSGALNDYDVFGSSICALGDLDGNGVTELAVGAMGDDDGGISNGAVWILFLENAGDIVSETKITEATGGFVGPLDINDYFGCSLAAIGDLDSDGVEDLIVGAFGDEGSGTDQGAIWILLMNADGTVSEELWVSEGGGGFAGDLDDTDAFGWSMGTTGDMNGDGYPDVAVGARYDDDGGPSRGAVWTVHIFSAPDASATWRNPEIGGWTNPDVYAVTALPILGSTFEATVDCQTMAGSFLVGYDTPLSFATPWGNALADFTDPDGELFGGLYSDGNLAVFSVLVPIDVRVAGLSLSTQGLRVVPGFDLTNAQDLVVGT